MQQKSIAPAALCVVALGISGVANAADSKLDTTFYGILSLDYVNASNVYNASTQKSMSKSYIDNGAQSPSRLGLKGSHEINSDLKLIFDVEAGLRTDTGQTTSGQLFNRGTYLGLSGNFGQVTAGRQWNLNDDNMGSFFVFGGYAAFKFSEFGDLSNLFNNSIKYYTPKFNGLQGAAMFGAGESANSSNGSNMEEAAVLYGTGPFNAAITYHGQKNDAGDKTDRLTSMGANMTFGPVRGRIGYAVAHYATLSSNANVYDIGVDYTVTQPLVLSLDYVSRDKKQSADDSNYTRLRAMYAIDKSVSVYSNLVFLKNKGSATEHFYGDGKPGQSQRLIGVGVQYVF